MLCTVGACLSADLVRLHVNVHTDPHYQSYCAMSERVNCETVAASDWAVFAGLPVAVWGLLAYLAMGALAVWGLLRRPRTPVWPFGGLWCLSAVSAVAGAALFVVSHFVIESVCLVCAGTYAVDVALLGVAWSELRRVGVGPWRALIDDLRSAAARPAAPVVFAVPLLLAVVVLELAVPAYWRIEETKGPEGLPVGFTEEGHPWIGAARPVLTVTEFSDYQCPHCRKGHDNLRRMVREHPDRLRLVHRNYPLDHQCNDTLKRPFHAFACRYAVIAHCAGEQGRFWEASDLLFAEGSGKEEIGPQDLAGALELDRDALAACADGDAARAAVQADLAAGKRLRIRGTPTFVVGDRTYPGRIPADVLAPVLGEPAGKAGGQ